MTAIDETVVGTDEIVWRFWKYLLPHLFADPINVAINKALAAAGLRIVESRATSGCRGALDAALVCMESAAKLRAMERGRNWDVEATPTSAIGLTRAALSAPCPCDRSELDQASEKISSIGGYAGEYDDFGKGGNYAVEQALAIIESLGGMDPAKRDGEKT